MTKDKAEKITRIYNWIRFIIIVVLLIFLFAAAANAQVRDSINSHSLEDRIASLETKLLKQDEKNKYLPQIHGILRGKFEYQTGMEKGRFEVRNARLSASGKLPLRSESKLEVDLCDESSIKMKDAWIRLNPCKSLRLTIGQQRMPLSIDAQRNPYSPTDLRFNYEKYWYPHGGAKESEQDKIVCELMIKF